MNPKTVLLTGATDGIGKLAARLMADAGHTVLLHGRNATKLDAVAAEIGGATERYVADFARLAEVEAMAERIAAAHGRLDVIINNAGVLKTARTLTDEGLDVRFVVNTLAPIVLTRRLLPLVPEDGRIVNLSSAAQERVDLAAMKGARHLEDMDAYAQSKLAITIWSAALAGELPKGPVVMALNPGSLLASKMVKEGFGIPGKDLRIGADILLEAAFGERFAEASGRYFDNDSGRFAPPHPAAADAAHVRAVMEAIASLTA
ncbi:MAG: SDR family NAD(P)-dependent oxidoreductase [Myxococcota bacterium]